MKVCRMCYDLHECAAVEIIDLYKLDKFTGCLSCFGCKEKMEILCPAGGF